MTSKKEKVILSIDNKNVPLNKFVQDALINTIKGFISSLKSTKTKKEIKIEIKV